MSNGDDWGDDGYMGQLPIGTTCFKAGTTSVLFVKEFTDHIEWHTPPGVTPAGVDFVSVTQLKHTTGPQTIPNGWSMASSSANPSGNTAPAQELLKFNCSNENNNFAFGLKVDGTTLKWWRAGNVQAIIPKDKTTTVNSVVNDSLSGQVWSSWVDNVS